jgi:hypothetical protein
MLDPHFVIVGAAIGFLGGLSYLIGTIKGNVRPNRVSWLMWALAPLVAFAAELQEGVGLPALMTFVVGFNPLLILIASFASHRSAWRVTRFDLTCGLLSFAGLGLWYLTRIGDVAILFAIVADALAAIPTLVKSYAHPESENAAGFLAFALNAGITLLTIRTWDFANYAFPLYICIICSVTAALIVLRPVQRFGRGYA